MRHIPREKTDQVQAKSEWLLIEGRTSLFVRYIIRSMTPQFRGIYFENLPPLMFLLFYLNWNNDFGVHLWDWKVPWDVVAPRYEFMHFIKIRKSTIFTCWPSSRQGTSISRNFNWSVISSKESDRIVHISTEFLLVFLWFGRTPLKINLFKNDVTPLYCNRLEFMQGVNLVHILQSLR